MTFMQMVILAAGRGTRMLDLTNHVPKPMLAIHGKPILAYKLESLPAEIDEVIFVIGYLGNQIQKYFGDFYAGKKILYVEQKELNGTGGAVLLVKDLIKADFLVMMGDDLYMKEDIEKIMKGGFALLCLEVDSPKKFGTISLDANGRLERIVEKADISGMALVNTGLYKIKKEFFDYPMVSIGSGEFGLPQALVSVAKDFPVAVERATGWFPIGDPQQLEKAQEIIERFI